LENLPITDDNFLVEPLWDSSFDLDNVSYGRYKVACETLLRDCYRGRHTIIRPQVVIGEGDRSRRLKHWLARSIAPGPRLAPGDGSDFLQVLDVLDLVLFMIRVIQSEVFGIFHLGGERVTWREFLFNLGYSDLVWVPVYQYDESDLAYSLKWEHKLL